MSGGALLRGTGRADLQTGSITQYIDGRETDRSQMRVIRVVVNHRRHT